MKYHFRLFCNLPNFDSDLANFLQTILNIAVHADIYGYEGILFHFNHLMLDPFILGSWIIQNTKKISPIIAVQPNYSTPVATAKMVQSLSYLYGRKVVLNMITGAAKNELEQVYESLDHDQRYLRLSEYIQVLKMAFSSNQPLNFNGEYYKYKDLKVSPGISTELIPDFFIAGSSSASTNVAFNHADVYITHPEPVDLYRNSVSNNLDHSKIKAGIKIGIIARETKEEAWEIARSRYPQNSRGKIITGMKKKSESNWLKQMAVLGTEAEHYDDVYWMGGFNSGLANNPILVGSIEEVTAYMIKYFEAGVSVVIVAGLNTEDDFKFTDKVFKDIKHD
jgi:alkanesulfonate monooxygenase